MRETPTPLHEVRPEVPLEVSAAIARALTKSPSDRYPSTNAFADALGQHPAVGGPTNRETMPA